jgi:hypothetical protein
MGDIWEEAKSPAYIVIPTNGLVKNNGECVMGRGLAYQAKTKFPNLPKELGANIKKKGNTVFVFPEYGIITIPVKHNWREKADLSLIEKSLYKLRQLKMVMPETMYLSHIGCGNGKLSWENVKPIVKRYLGDLDNVVICDLNDQW